MDIQKNVSLAPYTTFHIGGPADEFIIAKSRDELVGAVQYAKKHNLDFFLLGLGANILVGDKGYRGLVIKNEAKKIEGTKETQGTQGTKVEITAESGVTIEELINYTAELGLSGLEHYAGIPSTLGGALWQNLHFLSPDRTTTVFIGDIVQEAEILVFQKTQNTQQSRKSDNQKVRESESLDIRNSDTPSFPSIPKMVKDDYFAFGYDYSILHDTHDVVLNVKLSLQKENPEVMKQRIKANLAWRNEKHPVDATKKSAGSVFKKIEGHGAGRLIEQVGLKGKQIGDAQISERHANFIINTGHSTAKDVRELIQLAQEKVKEKFGLTLETEISFVGEF